MNKDEFIRDLNSTIDRTVTIRYHKHDLMPKQIIDTKWYCCVHYSENVLRNEFNVGILKSFNVLSIDEGIEILNFFTNENQYNSVQKMIEDLRLREREELIVIFYTINR